MSLQPQASYTVPAETARVARAIFPKGHIYAMAINLVRIGRWLADEPLARGRTSASERLRSAATPLSA